MNLEMSAKPPEFKVYVNYLGLLSVAVVIIGIMMALFLDELNISNVIILLILPVVLAAALTYSSRTFILKIDEVPAMDKLNDYIMEYLVSEELMNVEEDAAGIWMHSTKPWNRWFNHWFGTEKVRIVQTPFFVQVLGHRRYIDGLDSKLRFGRKQ